MMQGCKTERGRIEVSYGGNSIFLELPNETTKVDLSVLLESFGNGQGDVLTFSVELIAAPTRSRAVTPR